MSLNFIKETQEFKELVLALRQNERGLHISGVVESAKPYFLSALLNELDKGVVFIRSCSASLEGFRDECHFFLSQGQTDAKINFLPSVSQYPYQEIEPSLKAMSSRMKFFYDLLIDPARLTVTNLLGLLKPFPVFEDLGNLFFELGKGDSMERDRLLKVLASYGYEREDIINSIGEYAWRGGIVDLFSPWKTDPSRIEFSGDEIVSIREFNPSSQRSVRQVDRVLIPSLREDPGTWEGIQEVQSHFCPFSQYLRDCYFIIDDFDEVEKEWEETQQDLEEQHSEVKAHGKSSPPPGEAFSLSQWEQVKKKAIRMNEIAPFSFSDVFRFSFQSSPRFNNRIPFFLEFLKKSQQERNRCYIFLSNERIREKVTTLLKEHRIPSGKGSDALQSVYDESVTLLLGDLRRGFTYPKMKISYFSEKDIFTEERIIVSRPSVKPFLPPFRDLKPGDFVVHTDYGVGIFKGLVQMDSEGKVREFLKILYRDGDKLFVPMEDMNLVQKYASPGASMPVLSKLGTPQWERTKSRIKKDIESMTKELLELYAQRKAIRGHSFSLSGEWQTEFDETFAYEETDDQLRAIKEVIKDMESDFPMDRLLCGDVGYGKTEVALRAAFKAVMDGKQVALLCPTTVLANQHLETFQNRMVLFPVRIEGLTRFKSRAQQKKILEDLSRGLVDIVIGTHRLFSKDVHFHDLGLLIVDEEQRFGVRHKEQIKQRKANIDVLSMTATPIPRTLNFSLSGIRDISLIETPPKDRLAIHTVVTLFSQKIIASAILRELARGGQVYFVHNRIDDIDDIAGMIRNLVSCARVVVVHGQTSGLELEQKMIDFIHMRYNVLVATTIIENGIDIPLVNTLIVNRADQFGLAQLYQLRGRVGRSSRQAVAYFLTPSFSNLTPLAKERLKALQEFTELGSGFRLAAKDLEIRGAGDFLGAKQHGYMEALGFEYYTQLLEETISKLKGEPVEEIKPEIHLKVDIRIPEEYLPQMNLRLSLYKKISSALDLEALGRLKEEVRDRYGPFPPSVKNLFYYGVIKCLAYKAKILSIDRIGQKVVFKFASTNAVNLSALPLVLDKYCGSITPQGVMSFSLAAEDGFEVLRDITGILKELT